MATHVRRERSEATPFGATWIVSAPWAHPAWDEYAIFLCDLTTDDALTEATLAREDVTHEMTVWAINPGVSYKTGPEQEDWDLSEALLHPPNHGYQFAANSDDMAYKRMEMLVLAIEERRLSPDTDFRSDWNRLFEDGVTLWRNAFGFSSSAEVTDAA